MEFIRISEKELVGGFKKWMCEEAYVNGKEHFSQNTASSYCSYIRKAFQRVSEGYADVLDIATVSTVYCRFADERAVLCKYINDIIGNMLKEETDPKQLVLLRNARSAMMLYWVYLEEKAESFGMEEDNCRDSKISSDENSEKEGVKIDELISASELPSMSMTIDSSALVKRFLQQFKTENRRKFSDSNICYPIKLMLPMFGKRNKEVTERFLQQISDMRVLISEKGVSVKFAEVKKMDILPDGEIIVTDRYDNMFPLYTRTTNPNVIVKFNCKNEQGVPNVGEITRDHIVPISDVMCSMDEKKEVPCLRRLTSAIYAEPKSEIKKIIQGAGGIAEARNRLLKKYPEFSTEQFIDELLKELEEIEKRISGYEIMQGKYNRMKGGRNRKSN